MSEPKNITIGYINSKETSHTTTKTLVTLNDQDTNLFTYTYEIRKTFSPLQTTIRSILISILLVFPKLYLKVILTYINKDRETTQHNTKLKSTGKSSPELSSRVAAGRLPLLN